MKICHHKPLQIHVDNGNKCEASLMFWIMILKIIKRKKKVFSPMFVCYQLINEPKFFLYSTNNICRLTCDRWKESKETVMFWGCIWPDGCNWRGLVWSYKTIALSPPLVSYIGYFSGLNMEIFTSVNISMFKHIVQTSYQLWKVSVSLCRRSKK